MIAFYRQAGIMNVMSVKKSYQKMTETLSMPKTACPFHCTNIYCSWEVEKKPIMLDICPMCDAEITCDHEEEPDQDE